VANSTRFAKSNPQALRPNRQPNLRDKRRYFRYLLLNYLKSNYILTKNNVFFVIMLIRFKVANYRSFGKEIELSCIASPERAHSNHIFRAPQLDLRLLPVGAIYGANASGKSNLFKAIEFARRLIVSGVNMESSILVEPFKLDPALLNEPTRFEFEILMDDRVYNYSFAVNSSSIVNEALKEIRTASEVLLFSRNLRDNGESEWHLDYFKLLGWKTDEVQFVEFVAKGTPKNQLFLKEAHRRNVKETEGVWKWFDSALTLINPNSTAIGLEEDIGEGDFNTFSNQVLRRTDMGISHLGSKDMSFTSLGFSPPIKELLEQKIKEGSSISFQPRPDNPTRVTIRRQNGDLTATKLVSFHRIEGVDQKVAFDIGEESDGTQRILDLLPAFFKLNQNSKTSVYFIDELDRSLHSGLTRALVEGYLSGRPADARTQLLFTTHDTTLFDEALFRKDEIWLIEKNQKGESELGSLGDFKLRSDKRLMRNYLLGRYGATPNVQPIPFWSLAESKP
jgi:AAA15 family ATPase/GTPase